MINMSYTQQKPSATIMYKELSGLARACETQGW